MPTFFSGNCQQWSVLFINWKGFPVSTSGIMQDKMMWRALCAKQPGPRACGHCLRVVFFFAQKSTHKPPHHPNGNHFDKRVGDTVLIPFTSTRLALLWQNSHTPSFFLINCSFLKKDGFMVQSGGLFGVSNLSFFLLPGLSWLGGNDSAQFCLHCIWAGILPTARLQWEPTFCNEFPLAEAAALCLVCLDPDQWEHTCFYRSLWTNGSVFWAIQPKPSKCGKLGDAKKDTLQSALQT